MVNPASPLESLPANTVVGRLEQSVERHFDQIKELRLFRDLPTFVLYGLLKLAHVVTPARNSLLFTQGEEATQFFIVLSGCVKLFKTSADGKEAIFHLARKGDYVIETGLVGGTLYGGSAQIVDNTKILVMPLASLHEQFLKSSLLPENMLAMVTQRNQSYLAHMEQLTLRRAYDRVGVFFLKLWIEARTLGNEIPLPFEKGLIATYLDLRPETFSRVLKEFHQQGFSTEAHSLRAPHNKALCVFCDPTMAQQCLHAKEHCFVTLPVASCPYPQQLQKKR